MNITLEALSAVVVVSLGVYLFQKINHDYKIVKILKNYPISPVVKSGGIIDLDKLGIFLQNYRYEVETRGVEVEISGNIIRVWGRGELHVVFEAYGYLGLYRVRRVVKVSDSTSSA